MESLPLELLFQIFSAACADGGFTACSLALVSRSIYATSAPYRLQSVALRGVPAKIQRFLSFFKPHQNPISHVQHLYLTVDPCENVSEDSEELTWEKSLSLTSGLSTQDVWGHRLSQGGALEQASLIQDVLRTVAPTLRTLTITFPAKCDARAVWPCPFPLLQELAIVNGTVHFSEPGTTGKQERFFPSLLRMHYSLPPSTTNFAEWAWHAPAITHLRVSQLGYSTTATAATSLMGLYSKACPVGCLPNLQQVLIQPKAPLPSGGWCASNEMMYMYSVVNLGRSQQEARVPVYLVPVTAKNKWDDCARTARREWGERVVGEMGCWEVQEDWRGWDRGCMLRRDLLPWMSA